MKRIAKFPLTPVLAAVCATAASAQPAVNRTVLPVQEPRIPPSTTFDVRNAKMPKRFDVKAPAGAPNVVIVLIDDLGFGATSTFGGPIRTDVLDKLAAERPALQQLPHHRAVVADARGAEVGPQPSHGEHGLHHRDGDRLPRRDRPDPEHDRAAGGDAAPERLQHGRVRQVARDGVVGGERRRPVRPLADRGRASTSSTASSAARPTSGRRTCTTAPRRSNCRTTRTTTS